MRWLHTSDWHLGRGFHGHSLRSEQEQMLETVCAAVTEHQVDVLLIAGDIYDRALPPEWAVAALEEALQRITEGGTQVIITPGNHDSAARLGFGRGLMRGSGVHIRSALSEAWTPVEVTESDGGQTLVYGIPYLEPQLFAPSLGLDGGHHTGVTAEVIRRIWEDVERRRVGGSEPTVVLMAHLFAAAGAASDSERNIGVDAAAGDRPEHHEESIGGLAVVPLELFEGFDYVALGHLHGRQRLSETVRYSGSPLRLSFSETRQAKGAWLWDSGSVEPAQPLDWSIGRPLAQLELPLEELLAPETVELHRESYLQIKLTDPIRPARAFQRLQEVYPYMASFSHTGRHDAPHRTYSAKVERARTDTEVVEGFLEHVRGGRGASAEEAQLIAEGLQAVRP
ncbi:metallophosphoesterase family protein [Nesterenkonia sandarakina]|uniref:Nuclease SbcCD subunit D n=1 Tax=Nesterenkonia sandarakina TaxID=272918 RepID=A0A7Z0J437_9MICC|nr:exonuclease SbcCD subunit D C-terminal domain-containing protein [Nesterenkonia sandarakina]NYJ17915.1 exonuclease SbcD [Nesterenkonia sandarakina]